MPTKTPHNCGFFYATGNRMGTGFRIRLSALALSENGDAKHWYRAPIVKIDKKTSFFSANLLPRIVTKNCQLFG